MNAVPDETRIDREADAAPSREQAATESLSVVVVASGPQAANLARLLPELHDMLDALGVPREILVVADTSDAGTVDSATRGRARLLAPDTPGYGAALKRGIAAASGDYILTLDADLSHPSEFVKTLWLNRSDVTIASRYVPGGAAAMGRARRALSRVLNLAFAKGLDLPISDLSSGFRLYRRAAIQGQHITASDFDILQQLLVQAYAEGWRVREVPFVYRPDPASGWSGRGARVALAWLRQFGALWLLRNSILAADYDDRAHDSRIPLQRYWQRARRRHINDLIAGCGRVLDVGCGSSRIIGDLPAGSVAADMLIESCGTRDASVAD